MTALDRRYDTKIHRRVTRTVMVGDVPIGSEHPVVVQSMINEDTLDIDGSVAGILRLVEAGCEIVRVTTPSIGQSKASSHERFHSQLPQAEGFLRRTHLYRGCPR